MITKIIFINALITMFVVSVGLFSVEYVKFNQILKIVALALMLLEIGLGIFVIWRT